MNPIVVKKSLIVFRNIISIIIVVSLVCMIFVGRTTNIYGNLVFIFIIALLLGFIIQAFVVFIGRWTFRLETHLVAVPKLTRIDPRTLENVSYNIDTRSLRHLSILYLLIPAIFSLYVSFGVFLMVGTLPCIILIWGYMIRIEYISFNSEVVLFQSFLHKHIGLGRTYSPRYEDMKVVQPPTSEATVTIFYKGNKKIFRMVHLSWSRSFQNILDEVRKRLDGQQYELYAEP
jgi:hypothetical protein